MVHMWGLGLSVFGGGKGPYRVNRVFVMEDIDLATYLLRQRLIEPILLCLPATGDILCLILLAKDIPVACLPSCASALASASDSML